MKKNNYQLFNDLDFYIEYSKKLKELGNLYLTCLTHKLLLKQINSMQSEILKKYYNKEG